MDDEHLRFDTGALLNKGSIFLELLDPDALAWLVVGDTLEPSVEPTNNFMERLQRSPAQDRKAGRTSKTAAGAHRRSVIVSVLESLRLYLPTFTLVGVIDEIKRWWQAGQSCFTRLLKKMKLPYPSESVLDNVLPAPDG